MLVCTILLQKCCMLPPVVTSGRRGGGGGASQQGGRGMGESSFRCASWPVGGGVFSSFVFVPASRQCLWDGARATVEGNGYVCGISECDVQKLYTHMAAGRYPQAARQHQNASYVLVYRLNAYT